MKISLAKLAKSRSHCFVCNASLIDDSLIDNLSSCPTPSHYYLHRNVERRNQKYIYEIFSEFFRFEKDYVSISYLTKRGLVNSEPVGDVSRYFDQNGLITLDGIQQIIHKNALFKHFK